MTKQKLTRPIDLQAYDAGKLRFMVATALKEIDRLRAINAELDALAIDASNSREVMREERDALEREVKARNKSMMELP
jgi:hypothetical protein